MKIFFLIIGILVVSNIAVAQDISVCLKNDAGFALIICPDDISNRCDQRAGLCSNGEYGTTKLGGTAYLNISANQGIDVCAENMLGHYEIVQTIHPATGKYKITGTLHKSKVKKIADSC